MEQQRDPWIDNNNLKVAVRIKNWQPPRMHADTICAQYRPAPFIQSYGSYLILFSYIIIFPPRTRVREAGTDEHLHGQEETKMVNWSESAEFSSFNYVVLELNNYQLTDCSLLHSYRQTDRQTDRLTDIRLKLYGRIRDETVILGLNKNMENLIVSWLNAGIYLLAHYWYDRPSVRCLIDLSPIYIFNPEPLAMSISWNPEIMFLYFNGI